MVEESLGDGNAYEGPGDLVIPSNPEKIDFDAPKSSFFPKENSILSEFIPNANKKVP